MTFHLQASIVTVTIGTVLALFAFTGVQAATEQLGGLSVFLGAATAVVAWALTWVITFRAARAAYYG